MLLILIDSFFPTRVAYLDILFLYHVLLILIPSFFKYFLVILIVSFPHYVLVILIASFFQLVLLTQITSFPPPRVAYPDRFFPSPIASFFQPRVAYSGHFLFSTMCCLSRSLLLFYRLVLILIVFFQQRVAYPDCILIASFFSNM